MLKKTLVLLLLFLYFSGFAQESVHLISWNIKDFGQTKSSEELERMAEIVRDADILAIQEVVAGYGGAQAVAKLADILNRKGSQWDYVISNPTKSTKYVTERYAFIWKTRHIKIKNTGQLITELDALVDREPFYLDFYIKGRKLTVINFHSRPHDKDPEGEIRAIIAYLKTNPSQHPIILAGDFNVEEREAVFDPLRSLGYRAAVTNKRTTLKHNCDGNNYLNYAIDNIFFSKHITKRAGVVMDFVRVCDHLEKARTLSDHLPVSLQFSLD
tara:strand:+ start:6947 stop:7759 length:813 start_codon:yes stop_codon:yes gene_type:complete